MKRRIFWPMLMAIAFAIVMFGGGDRASAAIRIIVSDGNAANDLIYYSSNSQTAGFASSFDVRILISPPFIRSVAPEFTVTRPRIMPPVHSNG